MIDFYKLLVIHIFKPDVREILHICVYIKYRFKSSCFIGTVGEELKMCDFQWASELQQLV